MLNEERIKEAEANVKGYLRDELLKEGFQIKMY